MIARALILTLSLSLAACSGTPRIGLKDGTTAVQVAQTGELPAPTRADMFDQNRPYLIGPFDKLTIDVFGIDNLSRKDVQADAGGRFSFPLAGVVEAGGKTPAEVERMIADRLRTNYVRDPQVTVNLRETVSQVVTVDGQVGSPGLYPVVGRMTLMRAVSTAKGVTENAKLDDVVVFRTVNGQRYAALYNLKAIRRGAYADPEIFANDVVIVGDSPGRRLFRDMLTILPVLTTPLILLLQN
ncbi:polysaccharide export protein [Sphingomonas koreensis]|uniref:Polysaccharide export protein n=1 Tax=Sphingomonas koreensis TaxID=93064 RepID=A0A2M8WFT9_9SPHN|nr:polysaccharide biosynthesis/export family protein [Sphingomonas koreensis]PJI89809.1 polysaccharide export outer membrane protein [Sphingomonas koreensis]RSU61922.1 polysaccharide export protein [Sphingomonas koreensis]RSU70576.1 polysaccharide export protein [Sphingomonas koreensis]RSY81955.1 polysaccharide export protein [Sphingomonas koreensis]